MPVNQDPGRHGGTDAERARQHALDRLHVVDTLPDAVYQDLVQLAATVCDTPIAVVSLIDRERQWFKARVGLEGHETTRDVAVCDHAIQRPDQLMEIPDLAADARFADFPIVTSDAKARFYAGMPMVTAEGQAIGTVCVVDHEPRSLSEPQRASLQALSRIAMALLDAQGRAHQEHVASALQAVEAAAPAVLESASHAHTVAILELQGFSGVVQSQGERATERALQAMDQAFEACLRADAGDSINRVTSSPEFVAVLRGGDVESRLAALRRAAGELGARHGVTVLVGVATSSSAQETLTAAYLRADEDLSRQKDAQIGAERAAA